jgi:hypothetical protein
LAARNTGGRQTPPASPEERTAKREDAQRPAAVRPESAAAGELGKPSDAQETIAITGGSAALLVRGAPATDISARGTTRWRILGNTQLQRSRDGSAWDTVDFAPAAPLTAGHAPVDNVLWLVGRGGTIYVTADGVTFARVSFIDNVDLVAVSAQNRQQAVVTAGDGRAWRTTDGGASWTPR